MSSLDTDIISPSETNTLIPAEKHLLEDLALLKELAQYSLDFSRSSFLPFLPRYNIYAQHPVFFCLCIMIEKIEQRLFMALETERRNKSRTYLSASSTPEIPMLDPESARENKYLDWAKNGDAELGPDNYAEFKKDPGLYVINSSLDKFDFDDVEEPHAIRTFYQSLGQFDATSIVTEYHNDQSKFILRAGILNMIRVLNRNLGVGELNGRVHNNLIAFIAHVDATIEFIKVVSSVIPVTAATDVSEIKAKYVAIASTLEKNLTQHTANITQCTWDMRNTLRMISEQVAQAIERT